MKKRLLSIVTLAIAIILFCSAVYAANIEQEADRLNYWDKLNHTVYVTSNDTLTTEFNVTIPSGWSFTSGTNCVSSGSIISCNVSSGTSADYTVESPGTASSEYEVDIFQITSTNDSSTGNNVSFLRIQCSEIFHTLVEYGRGRGNYFYNSNSGAAGSGQTETGCAYLPNGTFIELNYLHKIYNVKQYYNVVAEGNTATYTCTYPNDTIVRQHLDTSISRSSVWTVDYLIEELGGSWERFGYIGMQFDPGAYSTDQNITINCTGISYNLPIAGGNMSCDEDSFTLEFRDREPFTASATSGTIYNGTQEVLITYVINNSEVYTASDVAIEIDAPQYAEFIGTRSELWGVARDIYRIEKTDFLPGESYTITLVARFNTTGAGAMTSLNLTEGISIEYTTCWEYNAYNPAEYIQDLTDIGDGTVNMGQSSTITNIPQMIESIYNMTVRINTTVTQINTTATSILTLSQIINSTVQRINLTVTQINGTVTNIYTDTQTIIDLLNCNGSTDSPICGNLTSILNYLSDINSTITQIEVIVNQINATVTSMNQTVNEINTTVNNIENNVTQILTNTNTLISLVNCTNITAQWQNSTCNRLNRIENYSINILNNITNIWGNYTAQDLFDAIHNITVSVNITTEDLEVIITEIERLREFDEELVFLVTDAFNANQRAGSAADRGDTTTAMAELTTARMRLDQATARLDVLKSQEGPDAAGKWWVWLLLVSLIVVVLVYLFQKVPEEEPPKYKFN